ncbi:hypothetical protein IAE35_24035 [Pseudomonas sp. S75]|uniref:hypothetical protein n=1 Tax=unclassified Pseudomonas TaxID=196821 RepID=UPI001904B52E|nr:MULTISPECIES: hypothetical protein [unclassified Pseudomonas]MBJ9977944.1 hypothetical protein [Pseudomonas sp. S30]MBK0156416.1 hypothetical protein [Pseudomonas sp. S75]
MGDSQLTASKPELYERLIDRLGLALEAARTSAGLRDEMPAELELRDLSPAEFRVLKAYLDRLPTRRVGGPGSVAQVASGAGKIVWLKNRQRPAATSSVMKHGAR